MTDRKRAYLRQLIHARRAWGTYETGSGPTLEGASLEKHIRKTLHAAISERAEESSCESKDLEQNNFMVGLRRLNFLGRFDEEQITQSVKTRRNTRWDRTADMHLRILRRHFFQDPLGIKAFYLCAPRERGFLRQRFLKTEFQLTEDFHVSETMVIKKGHSVYWDEGCSDSGCEFKAKGTMITVPTELVKKKGLREH